MEQEYKAPRSPDDGLQEKPDWQEIIRQARRDGWNVWCHPLYGWLLEEYVGPGPEAVVPDWIASLCEGAFSDRTDLTDITLPKRLKFIDRYAFSGCTGLTGVTIPKGVAEIRDHIFYHCTGLTEIRVDAENKHYRAVDGLLLELRSRWKGEDEDLNVLGSVKPGAYEEEDGDEDSNALDGMEPGADEEEESAECFNAFGVVTPGLYEDDGTEDLYALCGMKPRACEYGEDGDCEGFEKCYVLHSCPPGKAGPLAIPEGVRVINSEAFQDCAALSRVDIPGSVRAICGDTFQGCPGLTIHAPAGSYAEEYASRLGIRFSSSEV